MLVCAATLTVEAGMCMADVHGRKALQFHIRSRALFLALPKYIEAKARAFGVFWTDGIRAGGPDT